jgi:hypothetical protein
MELKAESYKRRSERIEEKSPANRSRNHSTTGKHILKGREERSLKNDEDNACPAKIRRTLGCHAFEVTLPYTNTDRT